MPNIYSLAMQPPTLLSFISEAQYALTRPIRQYLTKIQWLDWDEEIVGDYTTDVLDGNITIDASNNVRRTFSLTMNNADSLYIPWSVRNSMNIKIKIMRGIYTSTGEYWYNRGIFVLSDPEAINEEGNKSVELQGVDKWSLLNGDLAGTITETTSIALGTNVADAIRAVATLAGETKFAFDICTEITPYTVTREPGDTYADLILELADIPSWTIYYDVNGYLRFCPLQDPLQQQVVVDLSIGGNYRNCYISGSYNPEWSKIKNYWKVIGYSDSDTGEIFDGIAQNNNPDSPTNTSLPPNGIGIKATVLNDSNLTTDSLCEQRGAYELRKNLTKIDRCSIQIEPLPFLNELDCIQFEDSAIGLDDDKYQIQSISESLSSLGLMELECWKATSIFEIVAYDNFQTGIGDWNQLVLGQIDIYGFSGDNCLRKKTNADPYGGYKLLSKTCTDFEYIINTRRDATGTGTNSYSITDSSGNGYGISLDYSNNIITLDKRATWTRTTLTSASITPSLSTWYTLRLIKIASNFEIEIHSGKTLDFSSPLASVGTVDTSYTSFTQENVNGGEVYYSDGITVRKLL